MHLYQIFIIALGLSMDAFAAALCKGLAMSKKNLKIALLIALFFGGFQALMPLLGWLLGFRFATYIEAYDHWIAFGILTILGGKMLFEAIKNRNEGCPVYSNKKEVYKRELFQLGFATSIDAFAVGLTFAFFEVAILPAIAIIGLVTFAISLLAVYVGNYFGEKLKTKAEILGGIVLIGIGLKILIEHLFAA
jgi:putative Mn2+ efflux pump MntP